VSDVPKPKGKKISDDVWLRLMRSGFKPLLRALDWADISYTVVVSYENDNEHAINIWLDLDHYLRITEGAVGEPDWTIMRYSTLIGEDDGIRLSGSYYHTGDDHADQLADAIKIVKQMRL